MITHSKTRYTNKFYHYENDYIIGASIALYGEYTQQEVDLLKNFIDDTKVVYDIGGNIGYHTVAFASMAKEVHSFEPNDRNYLLLEKNTEHLNNVTLYHSAVSNVEGEAFISDYDTTKPGNYGECMMAEAGQPCKTVSIDNLDLPLPDVIKIDVEGHELKVFQGMQNTISKNRPVIFYESMHGTGFDIIHDMLARDLGYRIYYFPASNYNPNNYNGVEKNVFGQGGVINCIALPSYMGTINGLPQMLDRTDNYNIAVGRFIKAQENGSKV
jgi:FkbM family methyltransferase